MGNKAAVTAIMLSIIAVIGSITINFQKLLYGSPGSLINLIASLSYMAVWILILILCVKIKSLKVMMYCIIFWALTLFFSSITVYVNLTEALADWAIPFVILFLGPWYGISFFVNDSLTIVLIIMMISLVLSIFSTVLYKLLHKQAEESK